MTRRGVGQAMANSQHLWARSRWAPSLSGIEGGAIGGPARGCMRLMEEPGGRFAHGFLRRTGDAGSVTARGGDRKVSGGLDPIPSQRHTAWASRHTHLRIGTRTGPCLLPHCDASRARPSSGADLAQRYSRGWDDYQEQSENITLPALILSCPPRRHGRTGSGHPRRATRIGAKAWIPGTSPGMTARELETLDERSAGSPLPLVGESWRGGCER